MAMAPPGDDGPPERWWSRVATAGFKQSRLAGGFGLFNQGGLMGAILAHGFQKGVADECPDTHISKESNSANNRTRISGDIYRHIARPGAE